MQYVRIYTDSNSETHFEDLEIEFDPGDATIVEDTTGKGHRSRAIGNEPILLAVVQMPDAE